MAYNISIFTEDGREFELDKKFKTEEDAESYADYLMSIPNAEMDGSRIFSVCVGKD